MPDVLVWPWGSKANRRIRPAAQIEVNLPDTEKIEVVDHEGASQHSEPSSGIYRIELDSSDGLLHAPDHATDWEPLPKEKQEQEA